MALTVKEHNGFEFYVDETGTYAGKVGATGAEVIPAIVSAGLVPGVKAPAERVINAPDPSAVVNTMETTAAENLMNNDAPVNLQEEILETGGPTFSSGSPTQALPPAPTQTREELESALDEALQTDTDTFKYSGGDKTGKTVTFDDGSVLTQKGYSFKYADADGNPIDLDIQPGLKQSVDSKNEALRKVVGGIKSDLTKDVYGEFGGEEGALVSEYLADEAAAKIDQKRRDDKKDDAFFGTIDRDVTSETFGQRTGGRVGDLRDQVEKEAKALDISVEDYYKLPVSMRVGMGLSDIGEVFDSSQGELFQNPDDIDPNNPRNLGVLGSENLSEYSTAAKNYIASITPDELAVEPFDQTGGKYYSGYDDLNGALNTLDISNDTSDYEIFGDTGQDIYSIGGVDLGPGGPSGPGAGSNIGDGDGGGGDITDPIVTDPIVTDPIVNGDGDGVIDGGGGSGVTFSDPLYSRPSSNFGLTLDDVLVPSTVNYGTDPRFANLAPTFKVSQAAMPSFAGLPITPPVEETALMAQGGIVSLAGGGTPKGEGITPDFMIDYYNNSLIPRALDGNEAARKAVLEAHSNFSNFTLPEELLLKIKYGRANGGVASLSDTARNMFRPMVS